MAGFTKLYCIGGRGGFDGADGVNPILLQILVGNADRQWYEPLYVDRSIKPLGKIRAIIPSRPDDPNALIDACIAFYPQHFAGCAHLAAVAHQLRDVERLDFNLGLSEIPEAWDALRDEARPLAARLSIWEAELRPVIVT